MTSSYEKTFYLRDGNTAWTITGNGVTNDESSNNLTALSANMRFLDIPKKISRSTVVEGFGGSQHDDFGYGTAIYLLALKADATKTMKITIPHFSLKYKLENGDIDTANEAYFDPFELLTDGKGHLLSSLYNVTSARFK